ncbi:hypothetical protein ACS0TY_034302 [Phlomoides rotata]
MEHPFFPTISARAEALRWLTIAEKLLSARDLMGSKTLATQARESDPTLTLADQMLAVVDTLLAGDRRVGNNHQDWYAILRLTPQQGQEPELIAAQYQNLSILLNPQKNKFPFTEQAFRLTVDAWTVLSNPSMKWMYDKELSFYCQLQREQPDPFSNHNPVMHQYFTQVPVHANPQADPVGGGSGREAQIFMSSSSGSNLDFGGASGSKVAQEMVNKQGQNSYPACAGNVTAAPYEPNYSSVGEKTSQNKQGQESYPSYAGNVSGTDAPYERNYSSVGDKTSQNKQGQESYPAYAGNVIVTAAPYERNYYSVGEKISQNVNVNVNVNENENECVSESESESDQNLGEGIGAREERMGVPENDDGGLTFWTACPYCYHMYEYPRKYVDCTLRCQTCRKAFEGVVIPSPPPIVDGQGGYLCCWGFFPLGFSMENWEKNRGAASSWNPFSPMFTCPQPQGGNDQNAAKRVYIDDDDDEVFVELSDSDDDWNSSAAKRRKEAKNVKGKGASGITTGSAKKSQVDKGKNVTVSVQDGPREWGG